MTYDLQDSGDRTQLHGGAMRDRPPGKGRYDLISPLFLQDLAVLLEKGAEKYAVRNWELGYSLPLCLDSALRHLTQLMEGDDAEDHALAVAWNMMAFIHIRHMVRRGLLPVSLAEGYTMLHVPNPVTDTEYADPPEMSGMIQDLDEAIWDLKIDGLSQYDIERICRVALPKVIVQGAHGEPTRLSRVTHDPRGTQDEPPPYHLGEPESLEDQVGRLAAYIVTNIGGEPSQSQGAIDTAIRVLKMHYGDIDPHDVYNSPHHEYEPTEEDLKTL